MTQTTKANGWRVGPGHGEESGQFTSADDPRAVWYGDGPPSEPARELPYLMKFNYGIPADFTDPALFDTSVAPVYQQRYEADLAYHRMYMEDAMRESATLDAASAEFVAYFSGGEPQTSENLRELDLYLVDAPFEVAVTKNQWGTYRHSVGEWDPEHGHFIKIKEGDFHKGEMTHNHPGGSIGLSEEDLKTALYGHAKIRSVTRYKNRVYATEFGGTDKFYRSMWPQYGRRSQVYGKAAKAGRIAVERYHAKVATGSAGVHDANAVINLVWSAGFVNYLEKQGWKRGRDFYYNVFEVAPSGKANPYRVAAGHGESSGQFTSKDDPRRTGSGAPKQDKPDPKKVKRYPAPTKPKGLGLPSKQALRDLNHPRYRIDHPRGGDGVDVQNLTREIEVASYFGSYQDLRAEGYVSVNNLAPPIPNMAYVEDLIAENPLEVGVLMDEEGDVKHFFWGSLKEQDGEYTHSIDVPAGRENQYQGLHFTHNHPGGNAYGLSPGDIMTAMSYGFKSIRAVGKTSDTHNIAEAIFSDEFVRMSQSTRTSYTSFYTSAWKTVLGRNRALITQGKLTTAKANRVHNRQVAEEFNRTMERFGVFTEPVLTYSTAWDWETWRKANPWRVRRGHGPESGQFTSPEDPRAVFNPGTWAAFEDLETFSRDPLTQDERLEWEMDANFWSKWDKEAVDPDRLAALRQFLSQKQDTAPVNIQALEQRLLRSKGEVGLVYDPETGDVLATIKGRLGAGPGEHYLETTQLGMLDVLEGRTSWGFTHNHPGYDNGVSQDDISSLFEQHMGSNSTSILRSVGLVHQGDQGTYQYAQQLTLRTGDLGRASDRSFNPLIHLPGLLARSYDLAAAKAYELRQTVPELHSDHIGPLIRHLQIRYVNDLLYEDHGDGYHLKGEYWIKEVSDTDMKSGKYNPWRVGPGYEDSGQFTSPDDPRAVWYPPGGQPLLPGLEEAADPTAAKRREMVEARRRAEDSWRDWLVQNEKKQAALDARVKAIVDERGWEFFEERSPESLEFRLATAPYLAHYNATEKKVLDDLREDWLLAQGYMGQELSPPIKQILEQRLVPYDEDNKTLAAYEKRLAEMRLALENHWDFDAKTGELLGQSYGGLNDEDGHHVYRDEEFWRSRGTLRGVVSTHNHPSASGISGPTSLGDLVAGVRQYEYDARVLFHHKGKNYRSRITGMNQVIPLLSEIFGWGWSKVLNDLFSDSRKTAYREANRLTDLNKLHPSDYVFFVNHHTTQTIIDGINSYFEQDGYGDFEVTYELSEIP